MSSNLFLVLLLSCAALATSVSETILAFTGQTVILPCRITVSNDFPTVEWSKEGLEPSNIAFLYRDGCETHEMKNPVFRYRTHLIMSELKNGNISLRISNVQLSDAGKYTCMTLQRLRRVVTSLELVVVSEPKLSVVSGKCGEVTLQCEVDCWLPEPEITFLNDQGNNISAENPKRHPDSRGFFTTTRRATVQTATNRVTCRVHQPVINQTRYKEIDIPAVCTRSCTQITSIAVLVTVFLFGFGSSALIAFIYKKYGNSVGKQKVPQSSLTGRDLQVDKADDIRSPNTESNIYEKDKTICQRTEELNDPRSRQGAVSQQNKPTIDDDLSKSPLDDPKPNDLPSDRRRKATTFSHNNRPKTCNLSQNNDSKPGLLIKIGNPAPGLLIQKNPSCPALLTKNAAESSSSSSASTSGEKSLVRSMSMSESWPRRNIVSLQRSYTTPGVSYNRYTILANLPEE